MSSNFKSKEKQPSEQQLEEKFITEKVNNVMPELGYKLGKTIGKGSYSCVRIAFNTKFNYKKVACKIINKNKASADFNEKFLPRELEILMNINHEHIIKVLDMFKLNNYIFIFMNFCEYGDLLEYIRHNGRYSEINAKFIFRQLVSAVKYLHNLRIAHRDLKCENILLVRSDRIMLTDFGFSRYFNKNDVPSNTFCGSTAYAAPEIIQGIPYNPLSGDIWSLGCVLYIMLTGIMPFDDTKIVDMVKIQKTRAVKFPKNVKISCNAKVLFMKMLEPISKLRSSAIEIENSLWLRSSVQTHQIFKKTLSKQLSLFQPAQDANLKELRKTKFPHPL